MTPTLDIIRTDIEDLHVFLAGWLSGRLPKSRDAYVAAVDARLDKGFFNIQPAGRVWRRADLIPELWEAHGISPTFDIRISDVELHHVLENGLGLATYLEHQSGAQNSEAQNTRRSSLLFRVADPTIQWLSLHESRIDG